MSAGTDIAEDARRNWLRGVEVYLEPRVLAIFFLGFAAGLPLLLVFSTLSAWLREYGVSRTEIGFIYLVTLPYSWKLLWAPVVDRYHAPVIGAPMGKRRGWMIWTQILIALSLIFLGMMDPVGGLFPPEGGEAFPAWRIWAVVAGAACVAFFSATQDISLDAFRIESAPVDRQAAMAANYVFGYRVGMLVAGGAGALYIAEYASWGLAYGVMGALMLVGMFTVLLVTEPPKAEAADDTAEVVEQVVGANLKSGFFTDNPIGRGIRTGLRFFLNRYFGPLREFFLRSGVDVALVILLFVMFYRLSDLSLGAMANVFYIDMGYSKVDIANVTKFLGFWLLMIGGYAGGLLLPRVGVVAVLLVGVILVMATNLLFVLMAWSGPDNLLFSAVIAADNFSAGVATTGFIAFLSGQTNRSFTATQYAVMSSLMTMIGKPLASLSGLIVDGIGYELFFGYAAALGLPAFFLIIVIGRWAKQGRLTLSANEETPDATKG